MSEDSKRAWWDETSPGLVQAQETDDFLRPDMTAREPDPTCTETHYFGFNVPEHQIHGLGYVWYHPNLKTVTGGIAVWQGFKDHPLQSEIWDYVTYMSDECLEKDFWHYRLQNGYEVTTIEPLRSHRIQYSSPATDSAVDVTLTAMAPPAMLGSGMHFEQPMRTRGTVRLRGVDYAVDGTTVRDRSFGQPRREHLVPLPPLAWVNGAFSEDFAFGIMAFDDPARGPEWAGVLDLPGGNSLRTGWVRKDGVTAEVLSVSKRTVRRPGSFYPDTVEMTVVDRLGRELEIVGATCAGVQWQTWHNMDSNICLTRWECEGQVTHGDCQEFLWPEYVRRFHP
ncbi:DUF7064 domain-containing protein [Sporichthya polymorpha]|uniref:DUF7064 domain-containing protein n=1 Tax=Sporichthya polymorpha TaxID=35751 RepID=UPI00037C6326|nr:hypothetical protein [Sporichthya polymorpha]